ncbi:unnamed protein product [Gadus morhua 'NCC']
MSADDGHRECPDCLGAVHVLEDVDNPCSTAVDLSRGERLRRANQATEDTTGGAGRSGEPRTDSRGESTGVGETPVSSLMSRVLSAANIVGLQPPTPDPVPQGGVWEGVSHTSPPPSIPVAEDYTRMLASSWGRASKRPQFNAGCCQLAMTVYPAETGLGDMPPVEASIASCTSLGPARVSSNPSCPRKECAKMDRLVTRSFNASARAARTGNTLAMTLAALRRTLDPADGDAMGLVEAALSAHSQLTRDVGDSMAAAVLCRRVACADLSARGHQDGAAQSPCGAWACFSSGDQGGVGPH